MKCPKCGDARAEAFTPSFWTCPTCDAPAAPALVEEPGRCPRKWWYPFVSQLDEQISELSDCKDADHQHPPPQIVFRDLRLPRLRTAEEDVADVLEVLNWELKY